MKVACVFFALAVIALAVKLSLTELSSSTERHLLTASELAAIIGAVTAVAALLPAYRGRASPEGHRPSLIVRHLLPDEELIDRLDDVKRLVDAIEGADVVNCFGQRGSGKSFLLGHLADVVNGYRPKGPIALSPQAARYALYFDLADAGGFQDVQRQLSLATSGSLDGTWADFLSYIDTGFPEQPIMLILDNMNAPGLWPALGKAAYEYRARRPFDRLVVGSIERVTLINLAVRHVQLNGLDVTSTAELILARGGRLNTVEVQELHAEYAGLPLYTCLVAARASGPSGSPSAREVENVLDPRFLQGLPSETRRLLAYAGLVALVSRQVAVARLAACPLADLEVQLENARELSLVTPLPAHAGRLIKVHDIVRDAVLASLRPEVDEAAAFLFERARRHAEAVDASLFAVFADPAAIGAERFDEVVYPVIESAVVAKNHALLGSLHDRAFEGRRMREFIARDEGRADLFAYARASELAALGRYDAAQEALVTSSVARARADDSMRTRMQDSLLFLQADVAHLLNRYDEAADMFEELGDSAARSGNLALQARCTWGHGHVLRHQGRFLERALGLFDAAETLATNSDELFAKAYAVGNACGARLLLRTVRPDEETRLQQLETEIVTTSAHDGYLLELWKSRAQLAWFRGEATEAASLIDIAIDRALGLNDRLLYNLFFERAEYARFRGGYTHALADYLRVLDFGSGNHDRNLTTNAVLGVVLLELAAGHWLHHDSAGSARAAVLHARETAVAADIQLTAETAETVVGMLDETSVDPTEIRLILL